MKNFRELLAVLALAAAIVMTTWAVAAIVRANTITWPSIVIAFAAAANWVAFLDWSGLKRKN